MIKKTFVTIITFLVLTQLNAQSFKPEVFEGLMNDKMPITLFLKSQQHDCTPDIMYSGMYKYNGISNWLQLDITTDKKMQFVLVEYGFTGVLVLTKTTDGFTGIWISPNSKRQLKVELKKVEFSPEKIE